MAPFGKKDTREEAVADTRAAKARLHIQEERKKRERLRSLNQKLQRLKQEFDKQSVAKEKLTAVVQEREKDPAAMEREMRALIKEAWELGRTHDETKRTLRKLEDELASAQKQTGQSSDALRGTTQQIPRLEREKELLGREIASLEKRMAGEREKLKVVVGKLEEEGQMKEQYVSAKREGEQEVWLETQKVTSLNKRLTETEEKMHKNQAERSRLEKESRDSRITSDTKQDAKRKLVVIDNEIARLRREIDQIQKEVARLH